VATEPQLGGKPNSSLLTMTGCLRTPTATGRSMTAIRRASRLDEANIVMTKATALIPMQVIGPWWTKSV